MNKIIKTIALFVAATFIQPNLAKAQAVEQGTILIDGYYGLSLYKSVFQKAYAASVNDPKFTGLGPVGGRVEYLLSDKFGIGLDVGFTKVGISYSEESTDGNGNAVRYNYDFSTQKLGIMPTFNFHFIEDNDELDVYAVVGIGYGKRSYSFSSTDPNYTPSKVEGIVPIASKVGVGMRYFFTDNIGINFAFGLGQGGILNGGLSVKL